MNRRAHLKRLVFVPLLIAAASLSAEVFAAKFPNRPITLVVPFSAGGPTDALARVIADEMSRTLGQTMIVENKAGGNSIIGAQFVANANPDGYTLLMATPATMVMNPLLRKDLSYDVDRDLDLIELMGINPLIAVVSASSPIKSMDDLLARAKDKAGALTFASVGVGSAYHLAFELLQDMAKIEMVHVPYKGSSPALVDVISGTVDVMFDTPASALPHIRSGKLRPLAVTTPQRFSMLPDVPAVAESYPGYEAVVWSGLVAPNGLPADVRAALKSAIDKSLSSPRYLRTVKEFGMEPAVPKSLEEISTFIQTQRTIWGRIIRRAGIQI